MSIIIDNYETITKTIIANIRNGTIVSYNSERLEGLSIKELFHDFVNHFNFTHYRNKIVDHTIQDNILKINFPNKCVSILGIYFMGIGEIILDDISVNDMSSNNNLYFDLNALNIDIKWINSGSIISLNYIGYNEDYS